MIWMTARKGISGLFSSQVFPCCPPLNDTL
jgi:hypothetical protein